MADRPRGPPAIGVGPLGTCRALCFERPTAGRTGSTGGFPRRGVEVPLGHEWDIWIPYQVRHGRRFGPSPEPRICHRDDAAGGRRVRRSRVRGNGCWGFPGGSPPSSPAHHRQGRGGIPVSTGRRPRHGCIAEDRGVLTEGRGPADRADRARQGPVDPSLAVGREADATQRGHR